MTNIAMLWSQPILVTFPEPSIRNNWGEFFDQLNTYFGQPNLAQVSRMGFPTQLKNKKVEISKEKISQMIIKEKLSERAVVKERRLG